jgi:hypothetical protein
MSRAGPQPFFLARILDSPQTRLSNGVMRHHGAKLTSHNGRIAIAFRAKLLETSKGAYYDYTCHDIATPKQGRFNLREEAGKERGRRRARGEGRCRHAGHIAEKIGGRQDRRKRGRGWVVGVEASEPIYRLSIGVHQQIRAPSDRPSAQISRRNPS